jgi:uncharacterized LabA/DUF88 family protein
MNNYFFIDGSALIAQIRCVQKCKKYFKARKLDPGEFIKYFSQTLVMLDSSEYKRAVFYFPKGDKIMNDYLEMPNIKKPGLVRDMHFKYCGEKIKGSESFNNFVFKTVPNRWKSRFTKSEKGVDTEICCDVLKLAGFGKLDRLFILTNDDDFIPLFKSVKELGANVSLIHLSDVIIPNDSLLKEADSYDVVPDERLKNMFMPLPSPPVKPPLPIVPSPINPDIKKLQNYPQSDNI